MRLSIIVMSMLLRTALQNGYDGEHTCTEQGGETWIPLES